MGNLADASGGCRSNQDALIELGAVLSLFSWNALLHHKVVARYMQITYFFTDRQVRVRRLLMLYRATSLRLRQGDILRKRAAER